MIRPFTREDIPAVVELRSHFSPAPVETLTSEAEAFFSNPNYTPELPSLVFGEEGRIVGFMGVIPRSFVFDSRPITAVAFTQLIVHPDHQAKGIGSKLVRCVLNGPQAFTFADLCTEAARRTWLRVGGMAAPALSINAYTPLKPVSFACRLFFNDSKRLPGLAAMSKAVDAVATIWWRRALLPAEVTGHEPIDPEIFTRHLPVLTSRYRLRPAYNEQQAHWMLETFALRNYRGRLGGSLVRSATGALEGWYLYYAKDNGICQLLHLVAGDSGDERVLSHFLSRAQQEGSVATVARPAPHLYRTFGRFRSIFRPSDWFLFHSRDAEINLSILSGDALVTQLEGELAL